MAKRGTNGRTRKSRGRGRFAKIAITIVLAATIAGFAIVQFERLDQRDVLVLAQLADAELEPRLREVIAQGNRGLAAVVESLAAERSALRAAAFRILHEEIDRLTAAAADDAAASIDRLAHLLANNAPQLREQALAQAAELAERIIALSSNAKSSGITRIRDCHRVLAVQAQNSIEQHHRSAARFAGSPSGNEFGSTGPESADFVQSGQSTAVLIDAAPLAGGSLPIGPAQAKPLRLPEQAVASARPIRANGGELRRTPIATVFDTGPDDRSTSMVAGPMIVEPKRPATSDSGVRVRQAQHSEIATFDQLPQLAGERRDPSLARPEELRRLLELDGRLNSSDAGIAAAARAEAMRLRIDSQQLALARGAVDRDPQVRKEVVEALPLVGSVDARGWLLWLSHDFDAEVRRAAISLLATAGDEALKRRFREAAASDAELRMHDKAGASGMR